MLAGVAVGVLAIVIIVSCVSERVNIGVLAAASAYCFGLLLADQSVAQITSTFPTQLFLMMFSITLLFGIGKQNGALSWVTDSLFAHVHLPRQWYPVVFFALTFLLSAIGPGNIAATALIAPIAMQMAARHKFNPFLIAIMVCTGANAGAFSPIAPTGVITQGILEQMQFGNGSLGWTIFFAAALLQSLSALGAYLLFYKKSSAENSATIELTSSRLTKLQFATLATILAVIIGILFFEVPIIVAALVGSAVLGLIGAAQTDVLRELPWDTIMMVTGMSVLISMVEHVGGLDLATTVLARLQLGNAIHSVLALITGVVSAYSSSSGVVLPAFMPLIPGILEKMHAGTVASLSIAIAVGSHMVDVSPLSTLGALTIAAYPVATQRASLFKNLLMWGMSMSVVGALIAFIILDVAQLWQ